MVGPYRRRGRQRATARSTRDREEVVPSSQAIEIHRVYVRFCKEREFPAARTIKPRNLVFFERAATAAAEAGLTAEQYVTRQFQALDVTGVYWPSALVSAYTADAAQRLEESDDQILRSYGQQLALYEARAYGWKPCLVLADESAPFRPLFRVAIAVEVGCPEVVERYRQDAASELRSCPVLAQLFPEVLGVL